MERILPPDRGEADVRSESPAEVSRQPGVPPVERPPFDMADWPAVDAPALDEWQEKFIAAGSDDEKALVLEEAAVNVPESMADLLRRALRDSSEKVRALAAEKGSFLVEDEAVDVLTGASLDPSPEVHTLAIEAVRNLPRDFRMKVYGETIHSPHEAVRNQTAMELIRQNTKASMGILIEGLDHPDVAFHEVVNDQIEKVTRKRFSSYADADAWWSANAGRFDEALAELEAEPVE